MKIKIQLHTRRRLKIIKELAEEIKINSEEMDIQEFARWLIDLNININYDGWDYCIDFAKYLVEQMSAALDRDEWFGYEPKALAELEKIFCGEYDIIKIDNYGYPEKFEDTEDILRAFGIDIDEEE